MRARLVIINPEQTEETAAFSPLIVEEEGHVLLCGDDWMCPLPHMDLNKITAEDIRTSLELPDNDTQHIFLTTIRELPCDEFLSPAFLEWVTQWWHEEAEAMRLIPVLAIA